MYSIVNFCEIEKLKRKKCIFFVVKLNWGVLAEYFAFISIIIVVVSCGYSESP